MANNNILVVDDDAIVARFLTFRLAKKGYVVQHFDNGVDGFEAIRNLQPDLVILDMMMPGLDGREVVEIIAEKKYFDTGKILVLSGKEDTGDKRALFDLGVHDYITKPFSMEDLLLRIERALEAQNG